MEVRITTFNDLDFDKFYLSDHDPKQNSRSFRPFDTSDNVNANGTVIFKSYNSKST